MTVVNAQWRTLAHLLELLIVLHLVAAKRVTVANGNGFGYDGFHSSRICYGLVKGVSSLPISLMLLSSRV